MDLKALTKAEISEVFGVQFPTEEADESPDGKSLSYLELRVPKTLSPTRIFSRAADPVPVLHHIKESMVANKWQFMLFVKEQVRYGLFGPKGHAMQDVVGLEFKRNEGADTYGLEKAYLHDQPVAPDTPEAQTIFNFVAEADEAIRRHLKKDGADYVIHTMGDWTVNHIGTEVDLGALARKHNLAL